MSSQPDPEGRSLGTREKILEVAEHLIALHGTEGFQLKDVADAVGIRPPSVYAHFPGREAISREVAFRLYQGIAADLVAPDVETGDPVELMQRLIERAIRYFQTHPGHLRLVLRDLAHTAFAQELSDSPTRQTWWQTAGSFERILERGIEAGRFRPIRPAAALSQIVGALAVNLCWHGWDEYGNPVAGVPLPQVITESKQMAMRLLGVGESIDAAL